MKISCTAAALFLASVTGSTSAMDGHEITFGEPLTFTQWEGGTCPDRDDTDTPALYRGSINSVMMLGEGEFCVVDNVPTLADPTVLELGYSKLAVVACENDAVTDHWYKCTDATCTDCEIEYRSMTSWDSFTPPDMMEQCYTYTFSLDSHDTVKAARNSPLGVTPGEFENVMDVSYMFDVGSNEDDVAAYMGMVKDNSCIKDGPPPAEQPAVVDTPTEETEEPPQKEQEPSGEMSVESSSNVVAVSVVAVVATLATSMMLV